MAWAGLELVAAAAAVAAGSHAAAPTVGPSVRQGAAVVGPAVLGMADAPSVAESS